MELPNAERIVARDGSFVLKGDDYVYLCTENAKLPIHPSNSSQCSTTVYSASSQPNGSEPATQRRDLAPEQLDRLETQKQMDRINRSVISNENLSKEIRNYLEVIEASMAKIRSLMGEEMPPVVPSQCPTCSFCVNASNSKSVVVDSEPTYEPECLNTEPTLEMESEFLSANAMQFREEPACPLFRFKDRKSNRYRRGRRQRRSNDTDTDTATDTDNPDVRMGKQNIPSPSNSCSGSSTLSDGEQLVEPICYLNDQSTNLSRFSLAHMAAELKQLELQSQENESRKSAIQQQLHQCGGSFAPVCSMLEKAPNGPLDALLDKNTLSKIAPRSEIEKTQIGERTFD